MFVMVIVQLKQASLCGKIDWFISHNYYLHTN